MPHDPLALAAPLIKHYEGFVAEPYLCPGGYWTIGYGHVIESPNHAALTETEANAYLWQDMLMALNAAQRLIQTPQTAHGWAALTSFTFNLGAGALQRSTLRRTINRGAPLAEIETQWKRWVWAGGKKLTGLIKRRQSEWHLYTASTQAIPQNVDNISL